MSRHRASRPAVRRLLTAYACASIATGMPWPLLLVLVWDQYGAGPHGALVVGLVGAARMAPYVLLSWAVGSLGDHVARDRLVRATMALRLLFLAVAGVALAGDRIALGVVAASLAVAAGTPTYPAIAASLPGLAGARRAQATDLLVTIEVSSWVVGPALGGLLLAESMRPWTVPVALALAVAGLALCAGISIPSPVEKAPDAVAGMLRAVLRCRPALRALGVAGLLNLVATVTGVVLLPLSTESWGRGDAGFGLATACLGFGALGAPLLSRLVTITRTGGLLVLAGAVAGRRPLAGAVARVAAVGAGRRDGRGDREPAHRHAPERRSGPLPGRRPRPRRHDHGGRLPGRQPARAGPGPGRGGPTRAAGRRGGHGAAGAHGPVGPTDPDGHSLRCFG